LKQPLQKPEFRLTLFLIKLSVTFYLKRLRKKIKLNHLFNNSNLQEHMGQ
jgi:hypothetical protein